MKAWDLSTYRAAQTVVDISMYRPTNMLGTFIHDIGGARQARLVTGSNRLCVWPIKRMSKKRLGNSHTSSVIGAVYSSIFRQVITCDILGDVQIWNITTGKMTFKFNRAHGNDYKLTKTKKSNTTAIVMDPTGRRLVTCGDDGLTKIWNFSNGQCLRKCESTGNELSAVEFVVSGPNTFLLSGGWDKRLFIYPDSYDKPIQRYSRCIPALDVMSGGGGGSSGSSGGRVIVLWLQMLQVLQHVVVCARAAVSKRKEQNAKNQKEQEKNRRQKNKQRYDRY